MLITADLLSSPALAGAVLAYMDPGTTTSLFALLAPLLGMLAVFFGFLLWPFRRAFRALFGKKSQDAQAAQPESPEKAPPAEDSDREAK